MSKDEVKVHDWFYVLSAEDKKRYFEMNHKERRAWYKQNRKVLEKRLDDLKWKLYEQRREKKQDEQNAGK